MRVRRPHVHAYTRRDIRGLRYVLLQVCTDK
nr:MAG TPA: hypothetical protein [Caudoviricetes sp.]